MATEPHRPTIDRIRQLLQDLRINAGTGWDTLTDGLTFQDSPGCVLTAEAVARHWQTITPDDNDGQITDQAASVVMGASTSGRADLWVDFSEATGWVVQDLEGWAVLVELPGSDDWEIIRDVTETEATALIEELNGTENHQEDVSRFGPDVRRAWRLTRP